MQDVVSQEVNYLEACAQGNLNKVRKFLTHPKYVKYPHINAENLAALSTTVLNGHFEVATFLLTSKELTSHAQSHHEEDMLLMSACREGNLAAVKYLLTHPALAGNWANVRAQNNHVLAVACQNNQLEVLKYLLTSPDLAATTGYPDIHANKDKAFRDAFINSSDAVLSYLICDYRIEKTEHITDFIAAAAPDIEKFFAYRDLQEKLAPSETNTKKMKL